MYLISSPTRQTQMHISDGQVLLGTLKFLFFTMFFLSKKFVLKVFLQYALPKVFASLSAIYFSGFLLAMMDFFFFFCKDTPKFCITKDYPTLLPLPLEMNILFFFLFANKTQVIQNYELPLSFQLILKKLASS